MESQTPPKPALGLTFVVIWRFWGKYHIRAFPDYRTAENVYHSIIDSAKKQSKDTTFEAYLTYYLAGYSDDN